MALEFIVCYPDPILKRKSVEVTEFDDKLKEFCTDMSVFCRRIGAMGLSAPQVGHSKRVIVLNTDLEDALFKKENPETKEVTAYPLVLINPVIRNGSGESVYKEGCVSLPDIFGNVKRLNSFDLDYQTVSGEKKTLRIEDTKTDLFGTIVQHELDHLDGELFIDKLSPYDKDRVIKKINKLRKRYG